MIDRIDVSAYEVYSRIVMLSNVSMKVLRYSAAAILMVELQQLRHAASNCCSSVLPNLHRT